MPPWTSRDVLHVGLPVLVMLVTMLSVACQRAMRRGVRRGVQQGFDAPVDEVRGMESSAMAYAAVQVVQEYDQYVARVRPFAAQARLDLVLASALCTLHLAGMWHNARGEMVWLVYWLFTALVAAHTLVAQTTHLLYKLVLTSFYLVVMLADVRTALLADAAPLRTVVQCVLATFLEASCLFCKTVSPLPSSLASLAHTHETLHASAPHIRAPLNLYASPFSRATYLFMTPFIYAQYWQHTVIEAVPQLLPKFRAAVIAACTRSEDVRVEAERAARHEAPETLLRRMLRTAFPLLAAQFCFQSARVVFRMGPIVLLSYLLSFAQERDAAKRNGAPVPPLQNGVLLAAAIFVAQCCEFVTDANGLQTGRQTAMHLRTLLVTDIVSKILRRRLHTAAAEHNAALSDGHISNLVAVDVFKIDSLVAMVHQPLVEYPLTIVFCILLLFRTLGVSAIVGLSLLLIFTPLQTRLSRAMVRLQEAILHATDARLNLISEVLGSIKTVKFFAWEKPTLVRLFETRAQELKMLYRDNIVSVLSSLIFVGTPMIVTLVTFGMYTMVLGHTLTPQKAFTSLAIFATLRMPLSDFPEMLVTTLNALVSVRRINAFLQSPETDKYVGDTGGVENGLGFEHASFTYMPAPGAPPPRFQLHDITCTFPVGKISIVVGPIGSGKTSLLLALLGELACTGGKVHMPRSPARSLLPTDPCTGLQESVAYCSQSAWLLGTTIRENILFGSPFDEQRYMEVLYATALFPDLDILEFLDETEVGEKGTALSGGQKARVALARALYSRAKHILVDDALSAVDADTAQHLAQHAFCGSIAEGRTIILVTHAVALMRPLADNVIVMHEGRARVAKRSDAAPGKAPHTTTTVVKAQAGLHWTAAKKEQLAKNVHANAERTHRATTGRDLYMIYVRSVAPTWTQALLVWLFLLGLYVIVRATDVSSSSWLKKWVSTYAEGATGSDQTLYYLLGYIGMIVLLISLFGLRDYFQFQIAMRSSTRLYSQVIKSILYATPRFFDTTPAGRILNRLSKDVETIDQEITPSLRMLTDAVVTLVAILGVICYATPQFLYLVSFVVLIYYAIGALYLGSSRDLKRIESVQRSPLFTLLGETLSGTVTIRAYGDSQRVILHCLELLDNANRAFLYLWYENRWLSFLVDCMGAFVTLTTSLLLLVTDADAALMGFTLSYSVLIVQTILRIVRRYTMTEITLNSVERMEEYIRLPLENQGGVHPPAHWPTDTGLIEVKNLCVRYAPEFPLALDHVSFAIHPSEKVGIVGRTGSGKSTLSLCFFRFLEAEKGSIVIDGIDIAAVTLESLRKRLTIIPQESQLFQGSVRSNLDPFAVYDDGDMWFVLQSCQMAQGTFRGAFIPSANSLVKSLDDPVEQGGTNFSAGQRQLLSLARGMLKLRDSRILILDESTANLDAESDARIQKILRGEMAPGSTILTIAHRLKTIIDYDKVLVLDRGRIAEYDSPAKLLRDSTTMFYSLCQQSGDFDMLYKMACSSIP